MDRSVAAAPINRAMTGTEWALLLTMSVLWGGSFFFAGVALTALPPLTIVTLRVSLAAVMLAGALCALGVAMPRDGATWRAFFGMGLRNNAGPFCRIGWSQPPIASGLAAILGATTPFATVIVAHVLTDDEKLSARRVAGVLAGLAGVVVMIGPDALAGLG